MQAFEDVIKKLAEEGWNIIDGTPGPADPNYLYRLYYEDGQIVSINTRKSGDKRKMFVFRKLKE